MTRPDREMYSIFSVLLITTPRRDHRGFDAEVERKLEEYSLQATTLRRTIWVLLVLQSVVIAFRHPFSRARYWVIRTRKQVVMLPTLAEANCSFFLLLPIASRSSSSHSGYLRSLCPVILVVIYNSALTLAALLLAATLALDALLDALTLAEDALLDAATLATELALEAEAESEDAEDGAALETLEDRELAETLATDEAELADALATDEAELKLFLASSEAKPRLLAMTS